jgi:hypothetical protein
MDAQQQWWRVVGGLGVCAFWAGIYTAANGTGRDIAIGLALCIAAVVGVIVFLPVADIVAS